MIFGQKEKRESEVKRRYGNDQHKATIPAKVGLTYSVATPQFAGNLLTTSPPLSSPSRDIIVSPFHQNRGLDNSSLSG